MLNNNKTRIEAISNDSNFESDINCEIERNNCDKNEQYDLNYQLLNVDKIYLISKQYESYELSLDYLSIINDSIQM